MPQDLGLLNGWVLKGSWPHVACPYCIDGYLAVQSLDTMQSAESRNAMDDSDWEPEWICGLFQGVLKCGLPTCGEAVVIAGEYEVRAVDGPDGRWYGDYGDHVLLRTTQPALLLLATPEKTPTVVSDAIKLAASTMWSDPGAAANRLRVAIESLLTERGVRRYVVKNGRRTRLSAHDRILEFGRTNQPAAEALEAVKWIGNSGSHDSSLTTADVIEGAAFLGLALRRIYDDSDQELMKRIRAVNKNKGVSKSK